MDITINGIKFEPIEGIEYSQDYMRIAEMNPEESFAEFRRLVLEDLFFIVCFVMKIPGANRKFIVDRCREVQGKEDGGEWGLFLWARFHWKSTIITKSLTIQRILKYPKRCTMIISHSRPFARDKFIAPIMRELAENDFLKDLFPDVLYKKPDVEADRWSVDGGIMVKGHDSSRSEATLEGHGIKEGMPTGVHFDYIISDDLEGPDDVRSPEMVTKVRQSMGRALFLLTEAAHKRIDVIGTPYSHDAVYYPYLVNMVKGDGEKRYALSRHPATIDGTRTGEPVLVTREELGDLVAALESDPEGLGEYDVNCQLFINPTPIKDTKLNPDKLIMVNYKDIPKDAMLNQFMLIDPAGEAKNKRRDSWAIHVIAVDPKQDKNGTRNNYLIRSCIEPMTDDAAIDIIARFYMEQMIRRVGFEKINVTPAVATHVINLLAKQGRRLIEGDNFFFLHPGTKSKVERISAALSWPLNNGKMHIAGSVPEIYVQRLRDEMSKFPYWHDDGLDAWATIYKLIAADPEYNFIDNSIFEEELECLKPMC